MTRVSLQALGQAGFRIAAEGTTLLVDPFLAPRPDRLRPPAVALNALRDVDAVLVTHEHGDHLDRHALSSIVATSPRAVVVVPAPIVDIAAGCVPAARIVPAFVDRALAIGGAVVTPVPARHGVHVSDAYTFGREGGPGRYRFLGYVIAIGGRRLYHAGDTIRYTGMADRLRRLGIDVAILPINGRDAARESRDIVGNLDHRGAAELAADAGIGVLVPMHYDTIAGNMGDVAALIEYARERHPRLVISPPGADGAVALD